MPTVTTVTGTTIEIEAIAADWFLNKADPNGLGMGCGWEKSGVYVKSILFIPSAANDVLVIKNSVDGDENDATMLKLKVADETDQRMVYQTSGKTSVWPFIDFSECTFSIAANVKVLIELL